MSCKFLNIDAASNNVIYMYNKEMLALPPVLCIMQGPYFEPLLCTQAEENRFVIGRITIIYCMSLWHYSIYRVNVVYSLMSCLFTSNCCSSVCTRQTNQLKSLQHCAWCKMSEMGTIDLTGVICVHRICFFLLFSRRMVTDNYPLKSNFLIFAIFWTFLHFSCMIKDHI